MSETKTTLLNKFIKIQDLQRELDDYKKKNREVIMHIRSLSQKIPQMIRELELK